jgi:hypothetical protein
MTGSSRAFRAPTLLFTGALVPRRLALIALACLAVAAPAEARTRDLHSASSRREARAVLKKAEAVRDGQGVATGKELSPLLKDLAIRYRSLTGKEQRDALELLARPSAGQATAGEEAYAPEATEHVVCSAHYCVHWVTGESEPDPKKRDAPTDLSDADADGVPDFVETMSNTFEQVFAVENIQMGWREPTPDGTRGGDFNKVDVYLKQLGDEGIFGYSTPDPGQTTNSQAAFLVMDNDFSHEEYPRYDNPLPPLQVTAAHEYNHVLQFGYDVLQDAWMFESTAVWMEDRVFDDVNDYVSYLPAWAKLTGLPLTRFNSTDLLDKFNVKVYGDAVWNRWLDERYGQEVIRTAWEKSLPTPTTRRCSRAGPPSSTRSPASPPTPRSGTRRPAPSRRAGRGRTSSAPAQARSRPTATGSPAIWTTWPTRSSTSSRRTTRASSWSRRCRATRAAGSR